MFMEVEKVKVTDHYLKRSKERMNLCAKKAERVANLAYWRGYRAKDCKKACDIRFLESKSFPEIHHEAVAYNGYCFIFDFESRLVLTVYPLPEYFGKKYIQSRKAMLFSY